MNSVKPIKDITILNNIKNTLEGRNKMLFILGINTGLRISDILKLKVLDVKNINFKIIETKTNKETILNLTNISNEINTYIKNLNDDDYLFASRKGFNKSITRVQAWQILHDIGIKYKLNLGTHSMRKTFGYHYYFKTKDIATLQKLFNHANSKETLRYIGLDNDTFEKNLSREELKL